MILQDTHTNTNHPYLMMMAVVLVIQLIPIQWKSGEKKKHVESSFLFFLENIKFLRLRGTYTNVREHLID